MPILPSDTTANSRCRSTSRLLTKSNNHLNPPRPDGYNGFFVMTLVIVGQKMLSKDTPNNQKKTPPWRSNFLEKRRKEKKLQNGETRENSSPNPICRSRGANHTRKPVGQSSRRRIKPVVPRKLYQQPKQHQTCRSTPLPPPPKQKKSL